MGADGTEEKEEYIFTFIFHVNAAAVVVAADGTELPDRPFHNFGATKSVSKNT